MSNAENGRGSRARTAVTIYSAACTGQFVIIACKGKFLSDGKRKISRQLRDRRTESEREREKKRFSPCAPIPLLGAHESHINAYYTTPSPWPILLKTPKRLKSRPCTDGDGLYLLPYDSFCNANLINTAIIMRCVSNLSRDTAR